VPLAQSHHLRKHLDAGMWDVDVGRSRPVVEKPFPLAILIYADLDGDSAVLPLSSLIKDY
jgi:hypothetical protein